MKTRNWNAVKKIIAIIAFIFIILALLTLVFTPLAAGYEISVYNAYPWYFWIFLISSIFLGQIIIIIDIFYSSEEENNRTWFIGIITILIPVIILLFLPYIRGYFIYGRGDHLTHIGSIKGIIYEGFVEQNNFYPNMHILAASFTQITGCTVYDAANFIPRFFFFLSPVSLYLFFKIILNKTYEIKLAMIFASSILFLSAFAIYFAQYYQSFLFTPLLLYLYFKRGNFKNTVAFSILFILFITSYNFYHPINSLLLTIVFFIILIALFLYSKIGDEEYKINVYNSLIKDKSLNAILIVILLFFLWYFSFSYIVGSFYKVFSSIFSSTDVSFIGSQINIVDTYKPQIIDLVKLVIFNYGIFLIITLSSFICLLIIFIKSLINWFKIKKINKFSFNIIFSGLSLILFCFISMGAILSNFIVGWERFANWAFLFSFVFLSPIIYSIIVNSKMKEGIFRLYTKSFKIIILIVLLISLATISTFTTYRSPINRESNLQVTALEFKGMEWILYYRNKLILIDQVGIDQWRYTDAIYTYNLSQSETRRKNVIAPDHFTYNNKTSLGLYYNEDRYLIITKLGRIFYQEIYPDYKNRWRFYPEDFDKLQSDNAMMRIYSNGEFESYLHKSNKNL